MAEEQSAFAYVAIDAAGRRIKGLLSAQSDAAAFERLRRDGLSPVALRRSRRVRVGARSMGVLPERELAEFLSNLAALLQAGGDMRAALGILGGRAGASKFRSLSRLLTEEIAGGTALEVAFSEALGKDYVFVGALIAAGEASGDIAGGFRRASEILQSRIQLRDQLVSALSYPAFVFLTTIVAVGVILFFVVPSLAPLVEDAGVDAPSSLRVLFTVSAFLRSNIAVLAGAASFFGAGLVLAAATGLLRTTFDRLTLDGPFRRTASGLVFGGFAVTLGGMLAAGTPMSDALRLAVRSVRSELARQRLQLAVQRIRDGQLLSTSLDEVKAFPPAIARLASVGEASGALGQMLARAGGIEESGAIRRIESAGRILGPALIVLLGGVIGLLMAGLLSGVSQLGGAAVQ
jgi:type II secretory pathway component PulF